MASEIKVDTIVNAGGDNDSGIDLATNDNIKFNIAGSQKAIIESNGKLGIGTTSPDGALHVKGSSDHGRIVLESGGTSGSDNNMFMQFHNGGGTEIAQIEIGEGASNEGQIAFKTGGTTTAMTIDKDGTAMVGKTASNIGTAGFEARSNGETIVARTNDTPLQVNRLGNDGALVGFYQATSLEGTITVSGSTVSYNGFSGQHESSGIATNTPIGTVVSTIDELDTYPTGAAKGGQTRADHAKVKVSDTSGDSAVYGVVTRFDEDDKVFVASVGIGSVRVTGACAKGDLLESNGDGTAKVQSDDIVRSKTIGKVTIGNSNTGVKLVSCVLYCG